MTTLNFIAGESIKPGDVVYVNEETGSLMRAVINRHGWSDAVVDKPKAKSGGEHFRELTKK